MSEQGVNLMPKVKQTASADGLGHLLGASCLTGAGRGEDVGVTDAQLEVEKSSGGGDAAVPGVGLLYWVAVLQGVNPHPGLIWWRDEETWRWTELLILWQLLRKLVGNLIPDMKQLKECWLMVVIRGVSLKVLNLQISIFFQLFSFLNRNAKRPPSESKFVSLN